MFQPEKMTHRAYTPEELVGAHVVVSISALGSVRYAEIRDIDKNCLIDNVVAFQLSGNRREDPDGRLKLALTLDCGKDPVPASIGATVISAQVNRAERESSENESL